MGPLCHPRGSSQQPRFIEEGTGAALSEPVLGWGESGYSLQLLLPTSELGPGPVEPLRPGCAAGSASWCPQTFVLGPRPGSSWEGGREQSAYDLVLFVCLFLGP